MSANALPSLLNEEFIKSALQNHHKLKNVNALSVKACEIKLSPANGEHFCSEIYKVNIEYTLNGNAKNKSLIVKAVLPEEAELGSNEEIMLTRVLPGMEECLREVAGITEIKLHPKCLAFEHKEKKDEFYVLENLNSLGYYCLDRTKGLDLDHALNLMKKIALYHAAAMLYAKQFPQVIASLLVSPFQKGACDEISQVITFGAFEYVAKLIEKWPTYEHLSEKVRSLIPKYNRLALEVVTSNNSKFNVINHGDLWVNNFLFEHDKLSGKPTDVLFVDFQNCFWGSCGFDIVWFLNSSLALNVLKEKRSQLIQAYYDNLEQTLQKSHYPKQEIPTFEDVLAEIKRCEFIGLYVNLCEFPFFALYKSKSKGLDSTAFSQPEKMQELRMLMYENPRVIETLKYTLKYFEEINLL